MSRFCCRLFSFIGLITLFLFSSLYAEEPASSSGSKTLWQIGTKDHSAAEFALAPRNYARFSADAVFLVGVSDPKKDWPYVHPGPRDPWAGSWRHSFSIYFELQDKPAADCSLTMALVDAQSKSPPKIEVEVNGGRRMQWQPKGGRSNAALNGEFSQGKASELKMVVPADILRAGINEIVLTTVSGNWMIYDYLGFEAPQDAKLVTIGDFALIRSVDSTSALVKENDKLNQNFTARLFHHGQEAQAHLKIPGRETISLPVRKERETIEFTFPAVEKETAATVEVTADGKTLATRQIKIEPVRKWVIYLLPHSHVDIGYTHIQTEVQERQKQILDAALELAKQTAGNPPGERFKWNTEGLWPVDHYLREETPEKQQALIDAIKAGQIELDAFYGNELTALCRPEELMRLVDEAGRIGKRCGVKIEAAMISDVPGYTWGIVPVMASAGVKYFSSGPNRTSRIGRTLSDTGDKPFYWISPSGKEKVLCWVAGTGYSLFHGGLLAKIGEKVIFPYLSDLESKNYPYEYVQLRYCVNGDNGGPDDQLVKTVQKWNDKYAYPNLVIATTSEMMKDFENRYGDKIPSMQGDLTPYWEDGAGSSALETGMNRASAERLSQAETLWALSEFQKYPTGDFHAAWQNAVLYDEHTWGAHTAVKEPDLQFTKDQWNIKRAFAVDADAQSIKLLEQVAGLQKKESRIGESILVYNTSSWPRTDLVILPKETSSKPTGIFDEGTRYYAPSQRLSSGELAFLAKEVPAFGFKQYRLESVEVVLKDNAKIDGAMLSTPEIAVALDEKTGTIKSLKLTGLAEEFVDVKSGGLNKYLYVEGADAQGAATSGAAKITVKEAGPLVASLLVESDAPGCNKFTREIRVVRGLDRVDILNVIDKQPIRKKEGVHLEYPFNVPQGTMHMDLAWAVIRPEIAQLPGSCKNWYTVNRWVDVSNKECGVTWAMIDAPLVEIGGITANLTFSSGTPNDWIARQDPSQKLYSWVMNNHWYTNYRAEQEGPTPFRYSVRPHVGGYDPVAAMRFGIEQTQPLLVVNNPAVGQSLLSLQDWPDNVLIATMKPSNDGKAIILRLYEVTGKDTEVKLQWQGNEPKAVWLSNAFEEEISQSNGPIAVPGHGVVTVRVESRR